MNLFSDAELTSIKLNHNAKELCNEILPMELKLGLLVANNLSGNNVVK